MVNWEGTTDDSRIQKPLLSRIYRFVVDSSTFYRVHLTAFTFIPLIFSAIFYELNGPSAVGFVDSMFLCYSAMTVTGLTTVNLSTLTVLQQLILYFLMSIGHLTIVSWIVVLMRRRFFRTKCTYIVRNSRRRNPLRSKASFIYNISPPISVFKQRKPVPQAEADILGRSPTVAHETATPGIPRPNTVAVDNDADMEPAWAADLPARSETMPFSSSPTSRNEPLPKQELNGNAHHEVPSLGISSPHSMFFSDVPKNPGDIRSPTIEFVVRPNAIPRGNRNRQGGPHMKRTSTLISRHSVTSPHFPPQPDLSPGSKYEGMGGFPGPSRICFSFLRLVTPKAAKKIMKLQNSLTMMPSVQTIESRNVPWLERIDKLVIWRNSDFRTETLSDEQLEELGGAEYKALSILSYVVPVYFIFWQLITIVVILPFLVATKEYDSVFTAQPVLVGKPWFSFFQVMAAYTGGGMSLVDLNMIPFQDAYLMIVSLGFVILAGNHAMPIFLRLAIWVASKVLPSDSEKQVGLSFLLDHPRRCYLYMFPSHQTWFLFIFLLLLSVIEWVGFLVLSIGLPAYDSLPIGARVVDALFQGLAARASGFAIVSVANMAPALQFLYIIMMYIAIYPVALSIRSTNVYEERSLGVFESPEEDEEPADLTKVRSHKERVGKYFMWHMRRQMSIDIWWLVWGVFLVSVIERKNLLDESKKWFDPFRVVFELVSAFGGIGLSLGFPSDNYSFAGTCRPLSKLVIIVIMLRGRHRGLPVAVDRAVLLPNELVTNSETK